MTDSSVEYGMWTFPDYSDVRIELVHHLTDQGRRDARLGFIGAAVVVLHAAIEEWVSSYLNIDAHQYCQRYGKSFGRLWADWDPRRKTLMWKVGRLGELNTGYQYELARNTPEVRALQTLNEHRNRLVHMDRHLMRIETLGDPPPRPPDTLQLYEVGRLRVPITWMHEDGSERVIDQTHVIVDPWRGMNEAVVQEGLSAFDAMRRQYMGGEGDDVGTLTLPDGPIWRPRRHS